MAQRKKIQPGYLLALLLLVSCQGGSGTFRLVSGDQGKRIFISGEEPEYVHLAVADLIGDVKQITGVELSATQTLNDCNEGCLIVGSLNLEEPEGVLLDYDDGFSQLKGQWEAYRIRSKGKNLLIAGSDERGTMFGIYRFIETYLGVDPMYFWSGRTPEKRSELQWSPIDLYQESPSFKYRGWFINDEDLLTEWRESGGKRNIDYPYYGQVVNPEVMEKVVESLVRLQMNLIIPASFIDIRNPPEAKLVKVAARRGVFLSMHHAETMGVSGFTYFNYWKDKTGEEPLFSYFSNPDKMKEVWRVYAREWSKYPNVIWQIGLRGIADRPSWTADPAFPRSSRERGALISQAMETQMEIIREVDPRPSPPVTTTLWMEGSALNREGHLKIPSGITIVFSDNCPGWKWQEDFYKTERTDDYDYGVYYHHQLWGSGPHLAQGIPPRHTYEVFKEAQEKNTSDFAILNVSNVREFQLGLASSARMLYNFGSFDPDDFMKEWLEKRYGGHTEDIRKLYDDYFNGFVLHDTQQVPMLLDGQTRSFALQILQRINLLATDPEKYQREEARAAESRARSDSEQDTRAINDAHPKPRSEDELREKVILQHTRHRKALTAAEQLLPSLPRQEQAFLETNLLSHLKIMTGLEEWLMAVLEAKKALAENDRSLAAERLEEAVKAFALMQEGQQLNTKGEKWADWYRGEKKMNLADCKERTAEILELIPRQ